MTLSAETRLRKLERSAVLRPKTDIPDAELIGALDRRRLDESELRALYKRIEKPHAAAILYTGWAIKSSWDKMSEWERANTYIYSISNLIAVQLAWPAGTAPQALVGHLGDPLTWAKPTMPLTDDRRTDWGMRLRCWFAQHFVSTRGRGRLQAQIAEYVEAGGLDDDFIPILGEDECNFLLAVVDYMEKGEHTMDAPLLVWYDLSNRLCSS